MSRKWLHNNWKRWLIIIICLGLLIVRLLWPHIQFDAVTLWLVVIAAFFLIIPEPRVYFPYIKRVKLWEAEIELKEEVKELGREVDKVQESVANNPGVEVSKSLSPDVDEVVRESSKDPRAALLLLSAKIESQVKKRLKGANINFRYPLGKAMEVGVGAGLFPQEILPVFHGFWAMRNRVAHSEAFDVEDSTILALVSIGTELLKILSTERITEIDVLCRDGSNDPVVVDVFIREPHGVVLQQYEEVEALGFSFVPGTTLLSEILAHGWVKKEKEPIHHYQGGELPAWKLVRKVLVYPYLV
jgi:hypothetical protein